jgi:peptidase M28-like protein/PDZ domain-containing protein/WD40 repeat protein/PA domain-containing protein
MGRHDRRTLISLQAQVPSLLLALLLTQVLAQVLALLLAISLLGSGCSHAPFARGGSGSGGSVASSGAGEALDLRMPDEHHFGDLRQLTFEGENAEAYWSWDGGQLILQSTHPPYACDQIFRLPVDNGPADMSLVSTGAGRTTCSYFFPGNRHVLFASTHETSPACPPKPDMSRGYVWALYDSYDIFTARLNDQAAGGAPGVTELKNITHHPGYDAEATVCGKDGTIVFTSTRDGDIELYRMDPDGSNVVRLTHTPGYDGGAFFSPDCSKIVWRASRPRPGPELEDYQRLLAQGLVRPTTLELYVANADGSDAQQITYLGAASFGPSWFPSGNRLLFASNYRDPKGREFDIWAINPNGTGLERITSAPGFDGFPLLSPDGRRLAFSSNRHGKVPGETDVFVASWIDHPRGTIMEERGADRFYTDVDWLADDARQGRGVGTAGLQAAVEYVERRFQALKLEPAGEAGGFRHGFEVIVEVAPGPDTVLAIDGATAPAEAVQPVGFSAPGRVAAPVVAVGYGITAPELKWDDYRGLDVKGKVVLLRRFTPDGSRFEDRTQRRYSDARYKAWNAREHGAVAVLLADYAPAPPAAKGQGRGQAQPQPPAPAQPQEPERPFPHMIVDNLGDAGLPVVYLGRSWAERLGQGRHHVELNVSLKVTRQPAYNVVARVASTRPDKLPGVVVVGAHLDHLGYGGMGSLAPGVHAVHHGADDNASGVAALMEAGRILAEHRGELRRDVILVAFSAEEMGDVGSTAFTRSPPAGIRAATKDMVAMINMDMVGRMRENKLQVIGVDTAAEWPAIVSSACRRAEVNCVEGNGGYGPSDMTPFYAAGVPVLFLFTGAHRDYHKPTDEASRINAAGGAQVAILAADLATQAAGHETRLAYRASPAPEPMGDLRNAGASLGTVPDYVGPPDGQAGVLLAGVRPGGPAEAAGLRRGDIIVKIDGHEVKNVEDLMFVLENAKPGVRARIQLLRDGKPVQIDATYGQPTMR